MRIGRLGSVAAIALITLTVSAFVAACGSGGTGQPSGAPDGTTASDGAALAPSDASALALNDAGATVAAIDSGTEACPVSLPVACPSSAPPSYGDVAPLFASRCASCHTGEGGAPWPLSTYDDVANWADLVQADLDDCSMPPADASSPTSSPPMTADERMAILRWIACGLPR